MRARLFAIGSICLCVCASSAWSKPASVGDSGGIKGVVMSDTGGIKGKPSFISTRGKRNPSDQGREN